jgi:hypothetical protein
MAFAKDIGTIADSLSLLESPRDGRLWRRALDAACQTASVPTEQAGLILTNLPLSITWRRFAQPRHGEKELTEEKGEPANSPQS